MPWFIRKHYSLKELLSIFSGIITGRGFLRPRKISERETDEFLAYFSAA